MRHVTCVLFVACPPVCNEDNTASKQSTGDATGRGAAPPPVSAPQPPPQLDNLVPLCWRTYKKHERKEGAKQECLVGR